MVSVSPRMRDSLDYENPDSIDPRLSMGFRSLSLASSDWEEHEALDDIRPFAGTPDPSTTRKKKRKGEASFDHLVPFQYRTVADGDAFRLAVIRPGTGNAPVECRLIWEDSKAPERDYVCLSYCWETIKRDADIICDGYRLSVTRNLYSAMRSLRNPTKNLLIWADQLCINQDDDMERGHQVSIMKKIFSQAKYVIVWLGEDDDKTHKLFEYAKKLKRGDDSPKNSLKKLLNPKQLQDAIQRLLERPWFERVWVIPEVALSRHTFVQCGQSRTSWDSLVRIVRDVPPPPTTDFKKGLVLLGNPRQRIAILTQMIASQRKNLAHTDIAQLLILAKNSKATDDRDFIYAFYGLTHITTFPNYLRSVGMLYADIIHMYVNAILWETSYSSWHALNEEQRTFQLMSILYSAGALHQHHTLPSWIPDWTYSWHLLSIWCTATSNVVTGTERDEWSVGVRCNFRAGGGRLGTFEIVEGDFGMDQLRLSVIILDTIIAVSKTDPSYATVVNEHSPTAPDDVGSSTLQYGRDFFTTLKGLIGIATPGIQHGDHVAIVLGGDVPIVLRPCNDDDEGEKHYRLLCECLIQSASTMQGETARNDLPPAEDIVLI